MDPADVLTIALAVGVPVLLVTVVLRYRRLWRATHRELSQLQSAQLGAGDQRELMNAVDAIAIEMERVSEGQRFLTKVLAERDAQATRSASLPGRQP